VNSLRQRLAPHAARALVAAALLASAGAAARGLGGPEQPGVRRGTLAEIRGFKRVALLVIRTQTVDARDPARVAVETYRRALSDAPPRLHVSGHRAAARRLNKYIRKYRSISAVKSADEADFVIIIHVTRVRGSFIPAEPYVFGKLFVIARASGADRRPPVLWESKGHDSRIDDALGDFLKALKTARGEK